MPKSSVTIPKRPVTFIRNTQQDRRAGVSPRQRGIFPLTEAAEAGVRVALASDNHRDPFLPFGDLDPLQTLTLASFASHLAQPLERWSSTVTTTPATALNLPWDGVLREGAPADVVLLRARDSTEACSRWQADRMVVRAGRFIDTRLPDYRELDSPNVSADASAGGAKDLVAVRHSRKKVIDMKSTAYVTSS